MLQVAESNDLVGYRRRRPARARAFPDRPAARPDSRQIRPLESRGAPLTPPRCNLEYGASMATKLLAVATAGRPDPPSKPAIRGRVAQLVRAQP